MEPEKGSPALPGGSEDVTCAAAFQPILEHASRCLSFEEENARRLGTKTGLLSGAVFGFLTVLLFRLDALVSTVPADSWYLVPIFISIALGLGVLSSLYIFGIGPAKSKEEVPRVGDELQPTKERLELFNIEVQEMLSAGCPRQGQDVKHLQNLHFVTLRLTNATAALFKKNGLQGKRLEVAVRYLTAALIATALALAAGMYTAVSHRMDGGHRDGKVTILEGGLSDDPRAQSPATEHDGPEQASQDDQ